MSKAQLTEASKIFDTEYLEFMGGDCTGRDNIIRGGGGGGGGEDRGGKRRRGVKYRDWGVVVYLGMDLDNLQSTLSDDEPTIKGAPSTWIAVPVVTNK